MDMKRKTRTSESAPGFRERWRKRIRRILEDSPGERFRNEYRRRKDRRENWWISAALLAGAALLAAAGLMLSIPPGMPGFLLWVPALGLIASRTRSVAVLLDRIEIGARNIAKRLWPF
jgi:anti-sigma factor RsiW